MPSRPPAEIGMRLAEVDTPALLIELDAFERNLKHMAERVAAMGVRLRPHAKTHKSPDIARRQMALGAVGVCCQKVSEAEAMVRGGVSDVLISNEVVGERKLARLAALARQARLGVCVDDESQLEPLSRAARSYDVTLDVMVEIDVGGLRCGVEPGPAALALAERVSGTRGLRFRGLQAYHGKAQHIADFAQRRAAAESAIAKARLARDLLARNGIACEAIDGAGTGTFAFEGTSGVYNELQTGSYVFMDAHYARNLDAEGQPVSDFAHSLFVLATVMSKPNRERAVLDAGHKAASIDSGMPRVADRADAEYIGASDEHGTLRLAPTNLPLAIGDRMRLIPGHCDPTVNLHDWYVAYRADRVEALWPIARGPGF